SLVMRAADETRVPAGAAPAADRGPFLSRGAEAIASPPPISIPPGGVTPIPSSAHRPLIVAPAPPTSRTLSAALAAPVGSKHLYFYDAISPIVSGESLDRSRIYRASRWGRSLGARSVPEQGQTRVRPVSDRGQTWVEAGSDPGLTPVACGVDDGGGDYLNCPFTKDEYERFYEALLGAEKAGVHEFDQPRYFEGCLPIEVMAARGVDTLRFGPMKPVGLADPKTRREPYAVVQLRQDNLAGDHYSLVGFQTQMKWGEQARVLKMIPGLENAEF